MHWSIWMIVGLVLVATEILVPIDFWFLFVGVAAIVTGLLAYFFPEMLLWHELLLVSVLSLAFLVGFRPRLQRWLHKDGVNYPTDLIGERIKIVSDISAGSTGAGEFRGTSWSVRNESSKPLNSGESYPIASRDGLTIVIRD